MTQPATSYRVSGDPSLPEWLADQLRRSEYVVVLVYFAGEAPDPARSLLTPQYGFLATSSDDQAFVARSPDGLELHGRLIANLTDVDFAHAPADAFDFRELNPLEGDDDEPTGPPGIHHGYSYTSEQVAGRYVVRLFVPPGAPRPNEHNHEDIVLIFGRPPQSPSRPED